MICYIHKCITSLGLKLTLSNCKSALQMFNFYDDKGQQPLSSEQVGLAIHVRPSCSKII